MKARKKLNVRFLACVLVVFVVSGVGVHFVHGYQVKRNARALLNRADAAKEEKDAAKEMDYLARYLGFEPQDTDALARFGEGLDEQAKKSGSPRARITAFFAMETVLRRDPERRDIRRRAAESAIFLGKFSDAMAHLQQLHDALPDDAELESLMGRCEERQGRFAEAVKAYETAIRHAPDQIDNYLRVAALFHERLDKADKANATLDAMVKANPKSFQAYLGRARYRLRFDGKLPSALERADADVQRARELAPGEADVALVAADVDRAQGATEKACEVLRQAIQAHPRDARLYLALVALELRDDKTKEGLALVRQGLKELPDNEELLHALADFLVQSGELKEAERTIAKLREMKYAPALLDYLQARIYIRQEQWSKASALLQTVRSQLGRLPALEVQALLLQGQCHEQLGNPDQALLAYQQARKLDPLSISAHYRCGVVLMTLGRNDEAVAEFRNILTSSKPPAGMHSLLARALIVRNLRLPRKERDLDEVRRQLTLAAKENPDSPELPILQAEMLLLDDPKKAGEARQVIDKARMAHPDEVGLSIAAVQLAGRDGGRAEALRVLDRARSQPKLADRAELQLARLAFLMQQPAEAKTEEQRKKAADEVRTALAEMEKEAAKLKETDRLRLLNGLADGHLRLGDTSEAERLWQQIADQQPNNLAIRLVLFDMALLKNSTTAMDRWLAEIREIEGDNGTFWRYAEASRRIQEAQPKDKEELSESGRRLLREARQYLIEAARLRPSWPRIPALEAEIDELEGNVRAASDKYQQALKLGERRPAIVRKTVKLLFEQGRYDEGNQAVRKLIDQENVLVSAGLGKLAAEAMLANRDPASRDSARALEFTLKSVAPNSKSYQDHLWLGQMLSALSQPVAAEKALRHASELAPTAPETWVALVAFLAGAGKKAEAEQAIAQAQAKLPANDAAAALAACFESIGDLQKAEEQYVAARRASPQDLRSLRSVAAFYLRHNQPAKAEKSLREILAQEDKASSADLTWARRGLAAVLTVGSDRRRFEEALALIDKNLEGSKDALADQHARAMILATRLSRRKEAIHLFEDLAHRGPLPANERFTLVKLYLAEGNWQQAQLHMLTLLASPEGQNPLYEAYFAHRLLQHGAVADAEAQLARLQKALPNAPFTREVQARLLQAKGKDAEALAVVREYAKSKDSDLGRAAILLETLAQKSDAKKPYLDEAETLYRKYASQSDQPERLLALAGFLGRKQAAAEAVACCMEALKRKVPVEKVAAALTRVLRESAAEGEISRRVEKLLLDWLAQNAGSIPLLICLADMYDMQERFADAEAIYRQVLRKDAENVYALNNLAWLLAFKRSPEALVLVNKAIDLVGPSPELLDTRGVVHLMLGQTDRALDDLLTASKQSLEPNYSFHLARAWAAANKVRDARAAIEEANKRGFDLKKLHGLEKEVGQQLVASLLAN